MGYDGIIRLVSHDEGYYITLNGEKIEKNSLQELIFAGKVSRLEMDGNTYVYHGTTLSFYGNSYTHVFSRLLTEASNLSIQFYSFDTTLDGEISKINNFEIPLQ